MQNLADIAARVSAAIPLGPGSRCAHPGYKTCANLEVMMGQGRHFLQIPGPSPVPDRVLRAMDMPVIDLRSNEFAELGRAVLEGSKRIFQTSGQVMIFPSSGTGAWEAAIVNTLS